MKKSFTFEMNVIRIHDVSKVKYEAWLDKYVYDDGNAKHVLKPSHMIVRSNLDANGPVVYLSWNDDMVRDNFRTKLAHPVRSWYANHFGVPYMDTREITVERWYNLNHDRRGHSDDR